MTVRRPFRSHQTVKDVLEAMGIPHTEVDLILVNGSPKGSSHRPTSGDRRIAAAPMFEALDIGRTAGLRRVPLRDARFVVDVNLGRLARLLRVLASTCGGRATPTTRPWPTSARIRGAAGSNGRWWRVLVT